MHCIVYVKLFYSSLAAIKSRAKKEMEAEKKQAEIENTFVYSEESNTSNSVSGPLATSGIFFQCPMIGKRFFLLLKIPMLLKIDKYY